ncbi:DUF1707 domain-containing protein [Nonomuraea sp. NPDC050536]|uniref:DUF1707 domain-containing protein n=1 Tax=Nonomuraea sp. NPDC050536 TaxID=3364366 RepID=UPI0037CBDEF0
MTRVSDHEREATTRRLQEAYAEGRLALDEMNERLEWALTARTHADLAPALADLPAPAQPEQLEIRTTNGRIKRSGLWRVPPRLRIVSEYAKVLLDLRHAQIDHDLVSIDLSLTYGSATLIVPRPCTADADAVHAEWGSVTLKTSSLRTPASPHIQVSGTLNYGHLRIRHR